MKWKKLTQIEKGKINSKYTLLLDNLIQEYGFVEYADINAICPVMYFLKYGNDKIKYKSNNRKTSEMGYGIENPIGLIESPLMNHAFAFRDISKKVYYVSNPLLTEEKIKDIINNIANGKLEYANKYHLKNISFKYQYGDYSDIRYEILGKERSYCKPGETNLVLIYSRFV